MLSMLCGLVVQLAKNGTENVEGRVRGRKELFCRLRKRVDGSREGEDTRANS